MHKSIGFHTRLYSNNSTKIVGGSFGGSIDSETVERLVKSHFTVTVKNSGRAVFVDKEGREISLYLSVDPETTQAGKQALAEYLKEREKLEQAEQEKAEKVEALLANFSHDEIIRRLTE